MSQSPYSMPIHSRVVVRRGTGLAPRAAAAGERHNGAPMVRTVLRWCGGHLNDAAGMGRSNPYSAAGLQASSALYRPDSRTGENLQLFTDPRSPVHHGVTASLHTLRRQTHLAGATSTSRGATKG